MNPRVLQFSSAVTLLACSAPVLALTVPGWSSAVLFVAAALSIALLAFAGLPAVHADARTPAQWLCIAMAAPFAAAVLAAALRGDIYLAQFDAPLRLVLAIPVFLVMLRTRADAARLLRWAIPLSLVIVALHRLFTGQPERWPDDRVTVGFVDPLVFGYISLTFALMMFMAVSRRDEDPGKPRDVVVAGAAIALGFTLSVLSGSRSGWIAIPIVVAVWLHLNVRATRRLGHAGIPLAVVLAAVVLGATAYFAVPKLHQRINEAIDDVSTYSFSGTAPVSPVGLRITYLRIAGDLIAQHPLAGMGDTSHMKPPPASRFPYANQFAVDFAFHSAFHNQVVSDTVRRGIAGGVAAALMLLVPIFIHAHSLRAGTAAARRNAAMGIAWGACLFVASFSTEVVDLKYTASLYALMTAALCAGALSRHGQD